MSNFKCSKLRINRGETDNLFIRPIAIRFLGRMVVEQQPADTTGRQSVQSKLRIADEFNPETLIQLALGLLPWNDEHHFHKYPQLSIEPLHHEGLDDQDIQMGEANSVQFHDNHLCKIIKKEVKPKIPA